MTGTHVTKLRAQYGWSSSDLAGLLGVHNSTIYRWEAAGDTELTVDPLQRDLLILLARAWARSTPEERKHLREEVQGARAEGGPLRSLYAFLHTLYAEEDPTAAT